MLSCRMGIGSCWVEGCDIKSCWVVGWDIKSCRVAEKGKGMCTCWDVGWDLWQYILRCRMGFRTIYTELYDILLLQLLP